MYLFDDGTGKFIKVDLASQQVAANGTISRDERVWKLLPDRIRHGVLLEQMLYDSNTGRLYLLAQKEATFDQDKLLISVQGLVLKLPTFEFVGAMHESTPLKTAGAKALFLSQDGKRLLFTYVEQESEGRQVLISELYDTDTLKLLKTQKTEIPENWRDLDNLSGNTYLGLDLATVYPGGFKANKIDSVGRDSRGNFPLAPEVKRLIERDPLPFSIAYVDADIKRVVLWERQVRERVRRYPVWKEGKQQDVEEKHQREYSTGRFLVYDQWGNKLFELKDERLAGDYPKVVAVSPEGRTLYFALGHERLYAIDLLSGKRPVEIETHGVDVMFVTCIFADR